MRATKTFLGMATYFATNSLYSLYLNSSRAMRDDDPNRYTPLFAIILAVGCLTAAYLTRNEPPIAGRFNPEEDFV